jgi:hypothetical protein
MWLVGCNQTAMPPTDHGGIPYPWKGRGSMKHRTVPLQALCLLSVLCN